MVFIPNFLKVNLFLIIYTSTTQKVPTHKTLSGLSCWWKVRESPNRLPGSPSFLRVLWGSRLKASAGSRTWRRSSSAAWTAEAPACSSMAAGFSSAGPERTAAGLPPPALCHLVRRLRGAAPVLAERGCSTAPSVATWANWIFAIKN